MKVNVKWSADNESVCITVTGSGFIPNSLERQNELNRIANQVKADLMNWQDGPFIAPATNSEAPKNTVINLRIDKLVETIQITPGSNDLDAQQLLESITTSLKTSIQGFEPEVKI